MQFEMVIFQQRSCAIRHFVLVFVTKLLNECDIYGINYTEAEMCAHISYEYIISTYALKISLFRILNGVKTYTNTAENVVKIAIKIYQYIIDNLTEYVSSLISLQMPFTQFSERNHQKIYQLHTANEQFGYYSRRLTHEEKLMQSLNTFSELTNAIYLRCISRQKCLHKKK